MHSATSAPFSPHISDAVGDPQCVNIPLIGLEEIHAQKQHLFDGFLRLGTHKAILMSSTMSREVNIANSAYTWCSVYLQSRAMFWGPCMYSRPEDLADVRGSVHMVRAHYMLWPITRYDSLHGDKSDTILLRLYPALVAEMFATHLPCVKIP